MAIHWRDCTIPILTNSVPKYRKHRPGSQAVVTLGGVNHYLGPHGTNTSENQYDQLVPEWPAGGRRINCPDEPITVNELIVKYLKWARSHYRTRGRVTSSFESLKAALRPLRRLYGEQMRGEFGPKRFKALRLRLIERADMDFRVHRVARLKRSTINNYCKAKLVRIFRMWRWRSLAQIFFSTLVPIVGAISHLASMIAGANIMVPGSRQP